MLVGLAAAITLSLLVFRQPMVGLFYALLPLMAVVTVGWPAGLIVEAALVALIGGLSQVAWMPPLFTSYSLGAIVGGLLSGLVGWAATNALFTVTEWSLYSFEHARKQIGYWGNPSDYVSWDFRISEPAEFAVSVEYSCAPDAANSAYQVLLPSVCLEAATRSSGSWDQHHVDHIGTVTIDKIGRYQIQVRPKDDQKWNSMGLRSVCLEPTP